jgi:hypothetical protein
MVQHVRQVVLDPGDPQRAGQALPVMAMAVIAVTS